MKRWATTIIFAVLFVGGALFLWWYMQVQGPEVHLHGRRYQTTVVKTEADREKGLSGTASLPHSEAMLFVFPQDDRWGMWMKDMKYPIDIVWLDSGKKVIYLVKDARPSSYPNTIYRPDINARYVIELASGTIEQTGIKLGDPAGIPSGV